MTTRNYKMGKVQYTCPNCGKEFESYHSHPRRFCSRLCADKGKNPSVRDRFFSKVVKADGCWIWGGKIMPNGYGDFPIYNDKGVFHALAHRTSWEIHNGEIPDGKLVLHRCDVRACVNPSHLFLGSHRDNTKDMIDKGRGYIQRGTEHPNAKLTDDMVMEILRRIAGGDGNSTLAKEYGIDQSTISRIRHGKRWSHVG